MRAILALVILALFAGLSFADGAPAPPDPATADLLDRALALAQSVPDQAERADAVGRVAAEIARYDPKRALAALKAEVETHEASSAMAAAAEVLAKDNRLLGLATLLRIDEVSTVMDALSRIIALEAIADFDEAAKIIERVEPLTVRRMVEREVARAIWADFPGERASAVEASLRWAQAITDPVTRNEALAYAAEGAAGLSLERAQEIAQDITDAEPRDLALRLIVQQVAGSDPEAAQALLGRIETPLQRDLAGAEVVAGLAKAGRAQEALALTDAVRKSLGEDIENPLDQSLIRERLATAIVGLEPAMALSITSEVWPPADRYALQCRLAGTIGRTDQGHAQELLRDAWIEVRRIDTPLFQRRIAAAGLASAAVAAPELLDRMAEDQPQLVQDALPAAVRILATDDPEAALKLTDRLTDARAAQQCRAVVVTLIAGSHADLARSVAEGLEMPGPKSAALVALAAATRAG